MTRWVVALAILALLTVIQIVSHARAQNLVEVQHEDAGSNGNAKPTTQSLQKLGHDLLEEPEHAYAPCWS